MRDQLVRIAAGGQLAICVDLDDRAWLELTAPDGTATVHVGERELLLAIEALAMPTRSWVARGLTGAASRSV